MSLHDTHTHGCSCQTSCCNFAYISHRFIVFYFIFISRSSISPEGFLVDKFGKYKPVVVMSLLLNAIFHHSLLFIPQQEIPGVVPSAFVLRHADSGDIEVSRTQKKMDLNIRKYNIKYHSSSFISMKILGLNFTFNAQPCSLFSAVYSRTMKASTFDRLKRSNLNSIWLNVCRRL